MKKVVRMLGLCALVALAFTSCKKKENNGNLTFKATMPQTVSNDRTYISETNSLNWSANDKIKVIHNGVDKEFQIIAGEENKKKATFDATGEGEFLADLLTNDSVYFAYYPNAVPTGDGAKITIPDVQHHVQLYTFATGTYPMFGTNVGDNIQFNSNAGVLRIVLRRSDQATGVVKVGKLQLTSDDPNDALVGKMTYPNSYVLNPVENQLTVEDPQNVVTLICDTPQELTGVPGNNPLFSFDFVLFEGALAGKFNVKVWNENDVLIGDFNAVASGEDPHQNDYHIIDRKYITIMPPKPLTGNPVN